jgi:hypothetical protein
MKHHLELAETPINESEEISLNEDHFKMGESSLELRLPKALQLAKIEPTVKLHA